MNERSSFGKNANKLLLHSSDKSTRGRKSKAKLLNLLCVKSPSLYYMNLVEKEVLISQKKIISAEKWFHVIEKYLWRSLTYHIIGKTDKSMLCGPLVLTQAWSLEGKYVTLMSRRLLNSFSHPELLAVYPTYYIYFKCREGLLKATFIEQQFDFGVYMYSGGSAYSIPSISFDELLCITDTCLSMRTNWWCK